MDFYDEAIEELLSKKLDEKQLNNLKNKLAKKYSLKKIPSNADILLHASDIQIKKLKLITKPTRTLSGVAPIAIMCAPHKCPHGTCLYCPGGPGSIFGDVPQSYTGNEPSTMRSIRNQYDPYLVVFNRLEQFMLLGQNPQKTEIIIQGGTFLSMESIYKEEFCTQVYEALNDFSDLFYKEGAFDWVRFKEFFELPLVDINDASRTEKIHKNILSIKKPSKLIKEQIRNETAVIRCVGLTIETKPDWGLLEHGLEMLKLGCTRVELGVQTLDEGTLKLVNRGHGLKEIIESTRILKDLGFKINYHMMPGLPGSTKESDLRMLMETIENEKFRPDMYKIYPTMVMKGTGLFKLWQKGKYKAMNTKDAADVISDFFRHVPYWIRVMRVQRDIPTNVTEDGVDKTNLRQYVDQMMGKKGIISKDIRSREAGIQSKTKNISKEIKIFVEKYDASSGQEFFISMEDKKREVLFGYCRLRFPSASLKPEITSSSALVRELHVVGTAAGIGDDADVQHKGIGKKLLIKAEEIALAHKKDKIVVISGVGAREYYSKLGYRRESEYVVKYLGKIKKD